MIRGRDIVIVSSVAWNDMWQGHHELATRLAAAGNRVFFVENSGIRAPALRDGRRIVEYVWNRLRSSRAGTRPLAGGLTACTPMVLPPFGGPLSRLLNRRVFVPAIARAILRLRFRDPIVISYLPTDTAAMLVHAIATPASTVVAYILCNYDAFVTNPAAYFVAEASFLRRADAVLVQEESLATHCRRFNDNVHILPHGLNMDAFPPDARREQAAEEVRSLNGPVIGYVGGLHRAFDFDLVAAAAKLRPRWQWVLVGKLQVPSSRLPTLPNVHFLGSRPHDQLWRYLCGFDACIIPYLDDVSTCVVLPTKLSEYLAAGLPVIATPLPTLVRFNRMHGIIRLAADAASFVAEIDAALVEPYDPAMALRRREIAMLDDWTVRIEQVCAAIEAAGDQRRTARSVTISG